MPREEFEIPATPSDKIDNYAILFSSGMLIIKITVKLYHTVFVTLKSLVCSKYMNILFSLKGGHYLMNTVIGITIETSEAHAILEM
jgi:hypothetical protein